ncbi:hypothetical protein ACLMJK_001306 [Lecanora helva]
MASPPNYSSASSPPFSNHVPLSSSSKKRPSIPMPGHPPNIKRQKRASVHSNASALSAHPLRQTSFPPEESALDTGARSPSVDSELTGITGSKSGVTHQTGKKRGRKKKVEGSVRSAGREKTAEAAREGTADAPEDEDDDDDGGEAMMGEGEAVDAEAEVKKMAVLMGAFNAEQTDRYTMLRRAKLKKETVRKIVNHTVSQSVPPMVITTINGYTKTFIGTLIERARDVQQQWAALETPPTTPPKIPVDPTDFRAENPNNDIFSATGGGDAFADLTSAAQDQAQKTESSQPAKQRDLGPLLPDHFREALRRYKRDGDGGGTGLTGISVGLGVTGTASTRLGGKRLFK